MKKILYIAIAVLTSASTLTSCSDWLDVAPQTDVPADQLFETENGFMSSLAGLYITMTNENTYGNCLSFGLIEQLAQMYDKLPEGTTDPNGVYVYDRDTSGGFNTKNTLAGIWLGQYHIIANANNLLKWLDQNGEVVIKNEETRNMLRGEALAIRAFLHFDLLRGWGPMNYAGNPEAQAMRCIPYRSVTDSSKQPLLEARQIVEKIIKDLEDAKALLEYEKDNSLSSHSNRDRRFRFNYHAVNALLARVYNYAGMKEQALAHALEVIDNCGLTLMNGNDDDPILFDEVLCGLSMHEMSEYMSDYFSAGDKMNLRYYISITTMNLLFETQSSESDDMRARSTAFVKDDDKQMRLTKKYIDNDNEVIPLIRLPEMYYIACEALEGEEAAFYINKVRNKRGISISKNETCESRDAIIAALDREYRKEFYAEGQYFWFLKTHGLTGALAHNPAVTLVEERFIFPLPDNEKEYGWVNVEEDTDDSENEDAADDAEPEV